MKFREIIFPWWTIKLLKEKNAILLENLQGCKHARLIHEACHLNVLRNQSGMHRGIRRLKEQTIKLKKEVIALRNVERTLRHKLGEE
jgi:hypothetical protein